MSCYADTSFLLKLVLPESDSERAMAEFRSLAFPPLFYTLSMRWKLQTPSVSARFTCGGILPPNNVLQSPASGIRHLLA